MACTFVIACFDHLNLKVIISGDQSPQWTNEDLISYTEPKLGFFISKMLLVLKLNFKLHTGVKRLLEFR
jgi:hypothetical protein